MRYNDQGFVCDISEDIMDLLCCPGINTRKRLVQQTYLCMLYQ